MTKSLWQRLLGLRALCLLLLSIQLLPPAYAQSADYFSASVPVASQSARERERAAAEGLRAVLVRVSGTTDLEQYPQAVEALKKASSHIEQFHYEQVRNANAPAVEHLVMTFSPGAVERILQRAGLPYWPLQRPSTLVWLVEDDIAEGKRLINDRSGPVMQGLASTGQLRGLPLVMPLLDLEDQLAISAEQVWNLDEEAILAASERYRADTVLVGRYTRTSVGQWWTTWQFFHRGEGRNYDLRGEDGFLVGQQALTPLADYLAGLYALKSNAEGAAQLVVQIRPIDNFGAYRKALDYLQKLAVVISFNLLAVTSDSLLLSLQLNGSQEQLQNTLALDAKLRPAVAQSSPEAPWLAVPNGTPGQPLRLEWIGR